MGFRSAPCLTPMARLGQSQLLSNANNDSNARHRIAGPADMHGLTTTPNARAQRIKAANTRAHDAGDPRRCPAS